MLSTFSTGRLYNLDDGDVVVRVLDLPLLHDFLFDPQLFRFLGLPGILGLFYPGLKKK